MNIKDKIQSIIMSANNATGESDTTLTDAVKTLINGFGNSDFIHMTVTVGENTVRDGQQLVEYLVSVAEIPATSNYFVGVRIINKETYEYNEFGLAVFFCNDSFDTLRKYGNGMRYRNGWALVNSLGGYDCAAIPGTQYELIYCNFDT